MHFVAFWGLCFAFYCVDSFNLYIKKEEKVLLYNQMVFCATVLIADILYSLEFSVVVKDVQMCVYNIDTVYAYHFLFFFEAHVW